MFPDQLKTAKIIPIPKKGNQSCIGNFRPISILPAFNKMFERIICKRLVIYLEKNDFISDCQHGFRTNYSTETAVMQFLSCVYTSLERKRHTLGVFMDLSKAFDSLNHEILLHKLKNMEIRGTAHALFQSYLSSRTQVVYCNHTYSSQKQKTRGVPQGSVLGPILFLIYVNDIVNASSEIKYTIYADDTTLLFSDNDLNALHAKATIELFKVNSWICANDLNLNTTKTKCMSFKNRSMKFAIPTITLNGQIIECVRSMKFLGVIIDEHLNWAIHINHICLILSKIIGILYKIRFNLTPAAMISIYYTLFYSRMIYCVSAWACTWPSFGRKVSKIQNKFMRCMFFLKKFDSTTELYNTHKILRFEYVHKYFTLLTIYKNFKRGFFFKLVETSRNMRSTSRDFVCPAFRTTLFKNSIFYFGPNTFNKLPVKYKNMINSNLSTFKRSVKKHLLLEQMNDSQQ